MSTGLNTGLREFVQFTALSTGKSVVTNTKDPAQIAGKPASIVPGETNSSQPNLPVNSKENSKYLLHVVKSSDSVWSLARRYHCTEAAILALNGMKTDLIIDGHKLKIPRLKDQKDSAQPQKPLTLAEFRKEFMDVPYELGCCAGSNSKVDCVTLVWHYLKRCKGINCIALNRKHTVNNGHDLMHKIGSKQKCILEHDKGSLTPSKGSLQEARIGDVVLLGCPDKTTKIGFSAQHLGIVTGVSRDDNGNIVDLKVMHAAYKAKVKEQSLREYLETRQNSKRERIRDLFSAAQIWGVDTENRDTKKSAGS